MEFARGPLDQDLTYEEALQAISDKKILSIVNIFAASKQLLEFDEHGEDWPDTIE